ncbi:hypothetical protein LCGC14_2707300, partial [marine sediment metagenome]
HTVTKLVEGLTLNNRMLELERVIKAVPSDVIQKWVKSVPQHERDSWR